MLDALRQVIHLRAYAQKTPLNEYKHEAFALFERMLTQIREGVTRTLAHAQFRYQAAPDLPELPDFLTTHIDPFTGEDDTGDWDLGSLGNVTTRIAPLQVPELGAADIGTDPSEWEGKVSRNAVCPCGSGRKYKHCHGALTGAA